MDIWSFVRAGFLSLRPGSELRGGIPYAMTVGGAPWWLAFIYCVAMNALAAPAAFLVLNAVHRFLHRWKPYAGLFDRSVGRVRAKVRQALEKYGYWGLLVFVAMPLPFTGAWVGALVAWILGMRTRRSILFIVIGVAMAGVAVTLIMAMGISGLDALITRA